ncbi:4-hydroxy-3-methylbut-2-enyl diphosphate reductase [Patescibacteria group bacterium]
MKILLAKPRGFCAGVDRAIDVVELALQVYGKPIYVKHAIVHNDHVVKDLEKKGTIFVENVEEIPKDSNTVFSAHGSPPEDFDKATSRNLNIIDATCPLVMKVHLEAKRFGKEGYTIILIGHKGHVELVGTSGEAPQNTVIVETKEDVEQLTVPEGKKVAVLTQTTLSVDDTKEIIEAVKNKYPQALIPPTSDICFATTNRQRAVKALAKQVNLILVVGSKTSSNTNRLVEVAQTQGVPAFRINTIEDIMSDWLENVDAIGVTAGASAPEKLVQQVIKYLQSQGGQDVEELEVMQERVWFDLPESIKKAAKERGKEELVRKHTIDSGAKMSA